MADEQHLTEPAARHMHKPTLLQRLAAPKEAANVPTFGDQRTDTEQELALSTTTIDYGVRLPRDKALQRKRRIALLITIVVALAIPALLFALIFVG